VWLLGMLSVFRRVCSGCARLSPRSSHETSPLPPLEHSCHVFCSDRCEFGAVCCGVFCFGVEVWWCVRLVWLSAPCSSDDFTQAGVLCVSSVPLACTPSVQPFDNSILFADLRSRVYILSDIVSTRTATTTATHTCRTTASPTPPAPTPAHPLQ
jgi:hypothetical protein